MKRLPELKEFNFVEEMRLRWSDIDMNNHLNNAVYVTFFEFGRVEVLNITRPMGGESKLRYVIANLNLDFLREIVWGSPVMIGSRITKVGTKSIILDQALYQNDQCAATCTTVIVAFDIDTRKATELHPKAKEYFLQKMQEAQDLTRELGLDPQGNQDQ